MSKRGAARLRKVEKCETCGRRMRRTTVDRYQYVESGLSNVYLHRIVQYVCECGEKVTGLPNVERLHDLIFAKVLMKGGPLTGDELRFLRKYMGVKGSEFAKMVKVDPTTLSKWENGMNIGEQSDKLIRLAVGLAMTGEVKKAVEAAYRQVADKYLDFLNEINLKTTQGEPMEQTFDITARDLRGPELSFRWGLSTSPDVELVEA
jgi:transcriptional regulator with XRE-family HTH domain